MLGDVYKRQAYVFSVSSGLQLGKVSSPIPESNARFGYSVAASGNMMIIGSPFKDANSKSGGGRAYVYDIDTLAPRSELTSPTANNGGYFGYSVAIDGDIGVVGANRENGKGIADSGRAHVFDLTLDGSESIDARGFAAGKLIETLESPNAEENGVFGQAVAISGNNIVVGALQEDNGGINSSGRAYVFNLESGNAISTLVSPDTEGNARFGRSVAIEGENLVVGSYRADVSGELDAGRVYAFDVSKDTVSVKLDESAETTIDEIFANSAWNEGAYLGSSYGLTATDFEYNLRSLNFDPPHISVQDLAKLTVPGTIFTFVRPGENQYSFEIIATAAPFSPEDFTLRLSTTGTKNGFPVTVDSSLLGDISDSSTCRSFGIQEIVPAEYSYLETSADGLKAKVSADYDSAAIGELMDSADIKAKVDAVEVKADDAQAAADSKQDPISGQEAIKVDSDVVSLELHETAEVKTDVVIFSQSNQVNVTASADTLLVADVTLAGINVSPAPTSSDLVSIEDALGDEWKFQSSTPTLNASPGELRFAGCQNITKNGVIKSDFSEWQDISSAADSSLVVKVVAAAERPSYLEQSNDGLRAIVSENFALAAAGELMDSATIKNNIEAVSGSADDAQAAADAAQATADQAILDAAAAQADATQALSDAAAAQLAADNAQSTADGKQDPISAGDGIDIASDVVSVKLDEGSGNGGGTSQAQNLLFNLATGTPVEIVSGNPISPLTFRGDSTVFIVDGVEANFWQPIEFDTVQIVDGNGDTWQFEVSNLVSVNTGFTIMVPSNVTKNGSADSINNLAPITFTAAQVASSGGSYLETSVDGLKAVVADDFASAVEGQLLDAQDVKDEFANIQTDLSGKQDNLTAGDGIELDASDVISVKLDESNGDSYLETSSEGVKASVATDMISVATGKLVDSQVMKDYVDAEDALMVKLDGSRALTGDWDNSAGTFTVKVPEPQAASDVVTKNYVDTALVVGAAFWVPAESASADGENVALSGLSTADSIGGENLVDGKRYLLWQQTNPVQNGIYDYVDASGTLVRSSDADAGNSQEFQEHKTINILEGVYAGATFAYESASNPALESDDIVFELKARSSIADGSITSAKIAEDAVITSKIADLNVTTDKLAGEAVTHEKIAESAVENDNILDETIDGSAKIASGSISVDRLDPSIQSSLANSVQRVKSSITFDGGVEQVLGEVPLNAIVLRVLIKVTTPFNGTDPLVTVGDDDDSAKHMTEVESDLDTVDVYLDDAPALATQTTIKAYLSSGGSSVGEADIYIEYIL